jgi:poly(A) polymerase
MYLYKAIKYNIFKIISWSSIDIQQKAYVVGGYVRDFLLGKNELKKIDIVSSCCGIIIAKHVSNNINFNHNITIFYSNGTALIKSMDQLIIEFLGDYYNTIYTINYIAISLNKFDYGRLIDPFEGWDNLKKRIIRLTKNPNTTFSYYPLHMFIAIMLASKLHFFFENKAFVAIKKNIDRIRIIPISLIRNEFKIIIIEDKPSWYLNFFNKSGLLALILPELTNIYGMDNQSGYTHKENFYHTLEVVDNVSKYSHSILLIWAALFHDIGKYVTKKFIRKIGWTFHAHEYIGAKMINNIFKRLNLPIGWIVKCVKKIIQLSSRPISLIKATDSALRRLLLQIGKYLEYLIILCKSDITTKNIFKKNNYRNNFIIVEKQIKNIEVIDRIQSCKYVISGNDLMFFFNLPPSSIVGIIKKSIKKSVIEGKLVNEFNSVYSFIKKKL